MRNDLIEVCRALQSHRVRYILVGGHAVRLNGIVRATEDVDILVPFDTANGQRLIEGLAFLESARDMTRLGSAGKPMNPTWKTSVWPTGSSLTSFSR